MKRITEEIGIEAAAVPIDTTGAAVAGDYYSVKDYKRIAFIIFQGAWAGGTPAVTLKQATAVAGTSEKALSFAEYFSKTALTGTQWVKTAVVSDTFNLTAVANIITLIDIDTDTLDTNNGFDCVRLGIASPGSNADLIAVTALCYNPRYAGASIPDSKVD